MDATRGYRAFSVAEFWKKYEIKHALENIQALQQEVTVGNLCAECQKLLPHCANNIAGFELNINRVIEEIVDHENVDIATI